MKLRNFIYIYFPLLLTFVIGKLIFQTDMIMLGLIDGESVAAFGIPSKIMIFDMIVAFSFAPVVSVFVASENNKEKRKEVISYSISVALIAGFILTFIGIIFYPFFIKASILDEKIYSYAKFATLLLTISIPARLTQFVSSMILHSIGSGRKIVFVDSIILVFNFIFNYLLMFTFKLGFYGCVMSTVTCSLINCCVMLVIVKKDSECQTLFKFPNLIWLGGFLSKSSAEWLRLTLFQIINLITIYLIGDNSWILIPYTAASELQHFLIIPLIALMRAVAISLSSSQEVHIINRLKDFHKILALIVTIYFTIGLLVLTASEKIGKQLYSITDQSMKWWHSYILMMILSFVFVSINSVYRGIFQSLKRFSLLTKIEFISKWIFYVPILIIGIKQNNPYLTWSCLVIVEIFEFSILSFIVFNKKIESYIDQTPVT